MVTADWMKQEVLKVVPDALVEVSDLHGTGDHFHVRIISQSYDGVLPLQRQKPILNHFKRYIAENTVHALDLKCMTPKQAETAGDTAFDPHGGGQGVHINRIRKQKRE